MELARAWFTSTVPIIPAEFNSLVRSVPELANVVFTTGWPERITPLPERGEGRNHDLVLEGRSESVRVVACIEAKADEPFDKPLGEKIARTETANDRSRLRRRSASLIKVLSSEATDPTSIPWSLISYQLLTGAAGALLEAARDSEEPTVTLFVVHEFQTAATKAERIQRNAAEFARFVELVCGVAAADVKSGRLYRRRLDPSGPHMPALFIGKAVYVWRRDTP